MSEGTFQATLGWLRTIALYPPFSQALGARYPDAEVQLETYEKKKFFSMSGLHPRTTEHKRRFVNETADLERGKSDEDVSFARKAKSEFQFQHEMFGNRHRVVREKAPELGLSFIALLDESNGRT